MSLLKVIKNLLIIVIIFGGVSAYLDYNRLTTGEKPVFCKTTYDYKKHIETYRGLFYVAERKVNRNTSEKIEMSSDITYKYLNQKEKINIRHPKVTHDFVLFVKKSLHCPKPSKLLVELEDKKVYIDCIDSIKYKDDDKKEYEELSEVLKEKPKLLDTIINKLSLVGVSSDKTTEKYESFDDTFVNQHLYVYKCNNNVKDVYITMNPRQEYNYCK